MNAAASGRSPEEFDWILVQFNRHDIEPIIIAGQAVNIWGKTFREWDAAHNPYSPKINDLLPLTSNDMELLEIQGISALEAFKGVVGRDKTDPFSAPLRHKLLDRCGVIINWRRRNASKFRLAGGLLVHFARRLCCRTAPKLFQE